MNLCTFNPSRILPIVREILNSNSNVVQEFLSFKEGDKLSSDLLENHLEVRSALCLILKYGKETIQAMTNPELQKTIDQELLIPDILKLSIKELRAFLKTHPEFNPPGLFIISPNAREAAARVYRLFSPNNYQEVVRRGIEFLNN